MLYYISWYCVLSFSWLPVLDELFCYFLFWSASQLHEQYNREVIYFRLLTQALSSCYWRRVLGKTQLHYHVFNFLVKCVYRCLLLKVRANSIREGNPKWKLKTNGCGPHALHIYSLRVNRLGTHLSIATVERWHQWSSLSLLLSSLASQLHPLVSLVLFLQIALLLYIYLSKKLYLYTLVAYSSYFFYCFHGL